eukprot:TRINITY_DN109442_c0_g1_i1.p1 TRINITY_DN109442_c0_g1~~TRINITY_DN109442_c0_g1_i1.p1  ORF type:complete len:197 (-),score=21.56 TRINITY_DN109442_c0_g1_i1:88-678(-)
MVQTEDVYVPIRATKQTLRLHRFCKVLVVLTLLPEFGNYLAFLRQVEVHHPSSHPFVKHSNINSRLLKIQRQSVPGIGIEGKNAADGDVNTLLKELATQNEAKAKAEGRTVDKKLGGLRKDSEFLRYAKQHGATVTRTGAKPARQPGKKKGSARMRVEQNGVWIHFRSRDHDDLSNAAQKNAILAFKAMDITFTKK